MNKIILICALLIFTLSAFAQTQRELLPSFTEKGKSYFGFDLGLSGSRGVGATGRPFVTYLMTKPAISYQYNVLNRLSVGGRISNTTHMWFRNEFGQPSFNNAQTLGGSVFARYYLFKNNGFFIEGEYINEVNFLPNTRSQHVQKVGFNPGYTFIVGKNKNIALDLKLNITSQLNRGSFRGIIMTPTIGFKVPLGKKKITNPPTILK